MRNLGTTSISCVRKHICFPAGNICFCEDPHLTQLPEKGSVRCFKISTRIVGF